MSWMLSPTEVHVRSDLVQFTQVPSHLQLNRDYPRLARMVVTSERVIFVPPKVPPWYTLRRFLARLASTGNREISRELEALIVVEMAEITGIQTWKPRLSASPMLRLSDREFLDGISFRLLRPDSLIEQLPADMAATENHLVAVEAAWMKAKEPS